MDVKKPHSGESLVARGEVKRNPWKGKEADYRPRRKVYRRIIFFADRSEVI